jgi:CO dehydrogenase maturation factor
LKALLTHTILQRQELVLVDLAAGVEFMGRASVQGIDALVVVVEPGSRSIETAVNIARMAKELGIKEVAAIVNKITDAGQVDVIKSQLARRPVLRRETQGRANMTVIANIEYSPAVQEADLQQRSVFHADVELVGALKDAKDKLMDLISTGKTTVK